MHNPSPASRHLHHVLLPATIAVALLGSGCVTMPGSNSSSSSASPAPAPAPAVKSTAGMNDKGEVIDSSKVEAGSGTKVKGIGDWEGEITGKPAPGSKFTQLKIGMSMKQVTDLAGQPTDQGAYVTGKAWIPFYFGSDRHRYEMVYKGQGRLIFAGGGMGDFTSGNLIWIIHNATESGYR